MLQRDEALGSREPQAWWRSGYWETGMVEWRVWREDSAWTHGSLLGLSTGWISARVSEQANTRETVPCCEGRPNYANKLAVPQLPQQSANILLVCLAICWLNSHKEAVPGRADMYVHSRLCRGLKHKGHKFKTGTSNSATPLVKIKIENRWGVWFSGKALGQPTGGPGFNPQYYKTKWHVHYREVHTFRTVCLPPNTEEHTKVLVPVSSPRLGQIPKMSDLKVGRFIWLTFQSMAAWSVPVGLSQGRASQWGEKLLPLSERERLGPRSILCHRFSSQL